MNDTYLIGCLIFFLYELGHATVTRPRKVNTYQVINAQKQGLDAAIALTIPAGSDAQINPHQLGQELQGEASQAVFGAPVQLEQLVAHRLQELDHRWKKKMQINKLTRGLTPYWNLHHAC